MVAYVFDYMDNSDGLWYYFERIALRVRTLIEVLAMNTAQVIFEKSPAQNGYTALGVRTDLHWVHVDPSLVEDIVQRINDEIGSSAAWAYRSKDGCLRISIVGVCEKAKFAQQSALALGAIIEKWFKLKVSLLAMPDGLAIETAMIS